MEANKELIRELRDYAASPSCNSDCADVMRRAADALASQAAPQAPVLDYGYTDLFNAIAEATSASPPSAGINVSVKAFREYLESRPNPSAPAPAVAVDARHSPDENFKHFLSYSGLSGEPPEIMGKLRLAFEANLPPGVMLSRPTAAQPTQSPHPDDIAVDRFAVAMKAKMAASRANGRSGWDDPAQCRVEKLAAMLVQHVEKGDPVDIANFAMMVHQRGGTAIDVYEALAVYLNAQPAQAPAGEPVAINVVTACTSCYGSGVDVAGNPCPSGCLVRALAAPVANAGQAPDEWPMLDELHLQALTCAYEQGFSYGVEQREAYNPYAKTGSQAAAWFIGYQAGIRKAQSAQPAGDERLISRDNFYTDPIEDIAHALAHELEEAELNPYDLVTVNREKLTGIAKRVLDKARATIAAQQPAQADDAPVCCSGNCNQGRLCPLRIGESK